MQANQCHIGTVVINAPHSSPVPPPPPGKDELKARRRFIQEVTQDVTNRLKASIHHAIFVELGIQDDPQAVTLPWGYQDPTTWQQYDSVESAFEAADRRLLILGHPGAGKTTSLLHLASRLLEQAQTSDTAPIPFLVNLSTFNLSTRRTPADTDTRFEDWFTAQLQKVPGVTRELARQWITQGQVVALLDGLDEFNDDYRAELAALLNCTFFRAHPHLGIVVCSRTNDYAALRSSLLSRLQLRGCVELQSLTETQIDTYLEAAHASHLKAAIRKDPSLAELAHAPLTLSMLVLAYSGLPPEDLPVATTFTESRQRLFEAYVARMLQRQARRAAGVPFDNHSVNDIPVSSYRYHPDQTHRWLGSLALMLSQRMRSSFSLEGIHSLLWETKNPLRYPFQFLVCLIPLALCVALAVAVSIAPVVPFTAVGVGWALIIALAAGAITIPIAFALHSRWENRVETFFGMFYGLCALMLVAKLTEMFPGTHLVVIGVIVWVAIFVAYSLPKFISDWKEKNRRRWLIPLVALSFLLRLACELGGVTAIPPANLQAAFLILSLALLSTLRLSFFSVCLVCLPCLSLLYQGPEESSPVDSSTDWLIASIWVPVFLAITYCLFLRYDRPSAHTYLTGISLLALAAGAVFGGLGLLLLPGILVCGFGVCIFLEDNLSFPPDWLLEVRNKMDLRLNTWFDRTLLSPLVWPLLALGRRFPFRANRFVRYAEESVLLKKSRGEMEYGHRLLRDYFALRRLMPVIKSRVGERQLAAIRALGFQGESALDLLQDMAASEDIQVRAAAIEALGHIPSPKVAACLEKHLADTHTPVREAVVRSITRLPEDECQRLLERIRPLCDACEVTPLLTGNRELLSRGLYLLLRMMRLGPGAVPQLIMHLDKRDADKTQCVAEALGHMGDLRAVPHLIQCLKWRNRDVRSSAIKALGELGSPDVVQPLIPMLKDRDRDVRFAAIEALGNLGNQDAIRPLTALLRDRSRLVQIAAIEALNTLGSQDAVQLLTPMLRDRDHEVRHAAIEALGKIGSQDVEPLLIPLLKDPELFVRRTAIEALGKIGSQNAVLPLIAQLQDRDLWILRFATKALQSLGDSRAVAPIQALLAKAEPGDPVTLLTQALIALGESSDLPPIFEQWSALEKFEPPSKSLEREKDKIRAKIAEQATTPTKTDTPKVSAPEEDKDSPP